MVFGVDVVFGWMNSGVIGSEWDFLECGFLEGWLLDVESNLNKSTKKPVFSVETNQMERSCSEV